MFGEHLRISWPYEFRDAYIINVGLGRYSLSSLFRDTISNLGSWAMHSDFFYHFPALAQDVPKFQQDSLPVTIHSLRFQPNSLGYLSQSRTPSHQGTLKDARGTISDASKDGEDDQGWSCDPNSGHYNWFLDDL